MDRARLILRCLAPVGIGAMMVCLSGCQQLVVWGLIDDPVIKLRQDVRELKADRNAQLGALHAKLSAMKPRLLNPSWYTKAEEHCVDATNSEFDQIAPDRIPVGSEEYVLVLKEIQAIYGSTKVFHMCLNYVTLDDQIDAKEALIAKLLEPA